MNEQGIKQLLEAVRGGRVEVEDAARALVTGQLDEAGRPFATIDSSRALRTGLPEVVFGEGKTPEQITAIMRHLRALGQGALVTRCDAAKAAAVQAALPEAAYHPVARVLSVGQGAPEAGPEGELLVVCAGTSDLPVAEEAALVAEFFGLGVRRIADVGVAGLHRILHHVEALRAARAIIVCAGMEGALPSVVAGLTPRPVIAVPTSVGYGASLGGIAALLGMLNACASGIAVMNIDNGFGAAVLATRILRPA